MIYHCETCGANTQDGMCRKCDRTFNVGDYAVPTAEGVKNYGDFNGKQLRVIGRNIMDDYDAPYLLFENCPLCRAPKRLGCCGHYLYGKDSSNDYRKILPINFRRIKNVSL